MRRLSLFLSVLLPGLLALSGGAQAQLSFCNKGIEPVHIAIGYPENGDWMSSGWYKVGAGECRALISGELRNQYYYYYADRADGVKWSGDDGQDGGWFCHHDTDGFDASSSADCSAEGLVQRPYLKVDTGDSTDYTMNLVVDGEEMPDVRLGTIQQQCIARWEDSHQVHSVDTIVEWNYQATKTTMKKLDHCLKLSVIGPVDIDGVAKSYVDHCVDKAVNDSRSLYLFQAAVALIVDIYASKGAASAANLYAYIDHVKTTAISCLTDTGQIQDYLENALKEKFDATVKEESHWEYWEL
jgi:uncharacterized membrane protein